MLSVNVIDFLILKPYSLSILDFLSGRFRIGQNMYQSMGIDRTDWKAAISAFFDEIKDMRGTPEKPK